MTGVENLDNDFIYFDTYQQFLSSFSCKFSEEICNEISALKNFCRNDGKIKKLLCHDMKGGYLDQERFQGGPVGCQDALYTLFHWWDIDMFVYFSHHFITVPPPVWTKQAHLHGVLMLGTFITESKGGESMCREIFGSTKAVDELVVKMLNLCVNCCFDGWLINIENVIEKEHLQNLSYFLTKLRSELKTVVGSHSCVIWYDSVTTKGKLKWQNELNHRNSFWFDQVDGIFLNYNWNDEHLKRSVINAQCRSTDVFVGVDVFGRGCLGGGGWNSCKALEAISKHSLSIAVFAPGWISEKFPEECIYKNSFRFWNSLKTYGRLNRVVNERFCTNFGIGMNEKKRWFCMRDAQLQAFYSANRRNDGMHLRQCGLVIDSLEEQILFLSSIPVTSACNCSLSADRPLILKILLDCGKEIQLQTSAAHSHNEIIVPPCNGNSCKIVQISVRKSGSLPLCISEFSIM